MEIRMRGGVAVFGGGAVVLRDAQSALDLIGELWGAGGGAGVAIDKRAVAEEFFRLSTGVAGEILQKFVNYRVKLAIFGDFSGYTSKPLRDFIRESNEGKDIFFVATEDEAVARISEASDGA